MAYVVEYENLEYCLTVKNLDGVSWADAPLPRRWHRCWAQTVCMDRGTFIARCACGAMQMNGDGWGLRNERRRRGHRRGCGGLVASR